MLYNFYTTSFPCEAKFIAKNLTSISRDGKKLRHYGQAFLFFSMFIFCVHNTAFIRVSSVFLFVCLVSPFCRIKHVTYVNVNTLYCMCIYV